MHQEEKLRAFRASYPNKTLKVADAVWSYRVCGDGARTLLMPPGGELVNDMGFDLASRLAQRYRVVYPAYARLKTLAELADGIAAILEAENCARATVLGTSFGGAVSQCLVRRYPDKVERLILSNTGVPQANLVRARKTVNTVLGMVPWPLLQKMLARSILKLLGAPAGEVPFWRAYCRELFETRLGKADVLANLAIQREYHEAYQFGPEDLASWRGKVFVIESDNDLFNAARRKAVRDTYPQAPVYTFHGAGHTPAVSRAGEYGEVLEKFLAAN